MKINGIEITRPEKILFPKKIKKIDLINYYKGVARFILPFLKNKPLTLQRFPNGIDKPSFFQKSASDYFPDWIKTFKKKDTEYVICNDKKTLIYLANQAVIPIHTWTSTIDKENYPKTLVFDLDPPGISQNAIDLMIEAALTLKRILEELKLKGFVMTTGSRGIHILIPLKQKQTNIQVRDFAKDIATLVESLNPKKFTTLITKKYRKRKVFLDIFRNSPSQTSVSPYSVRPYFQAPVSSPIEWSQLKDNFNSKKFNIFNVFAQIKNNPWKDYHKKSYSLSKSLKKLKKLRKAAGL